MAAGVAPEVEARRSEQQLLTELVAELRGADRLTPPELVRLDRVRLLLAARGIALRDPRAALWLAPVVCTSGSQQARFLERFATLFDVPVEKLRPASPELPVVAETPPLPWWRRHPRLWAFAAAVPLLLGWLVWDLSHRPDRASGETVTFQQVLRVMVGAAPAGEPPSTAVAWLAIAVAAAILLVLLVAGHRLWRRARRARRRDEFEPRHMESRSLAFAAALPRLYASARLRHRLGGLRRHRIVPSPRIHVRRSIRATIKAGGRPVLLYGTRPVTPDYVLLSDRESPRDHLPVVAQILSKRFSEEGVAAAAYDYFGDPRRVRRTFPAQEEAELSIERVASRHGGARFLLLAEPAHCLDSAGRAAPWLADLPEERPVLLDPRGEPCWDWREEEIEGAGVRLFPASPAGIGEYADAIQARADDGGRRRPRARDGRVDLPALLDGRRAALIREAAPDEGEVRDLLDELELWLGAEAMVVLRSAAVFPLVEPSLTVLLASRLVDREGKALLTEERLLALARLPWLRIGRMPAWLRGSLARGLTAEQLAVTVATIHAFLNPVQDGPKGRLKLDFAQADDPAARERLLDWLRRHPSSLYGDDLLLHAVGGRPPAELGLELDPEPMKRLRAALGKVDPVRDGVALVVSGVAAVALAVLMPAREMPPTEQPADRPAPPPATVQADTDTVGSNAAAPAPDSRNPSADTGTALEDSSVAENAAAVDSRAVEADARADEIEAMADAAADAQCNSIGAAGIIETGPCSGGGRTVEAVTTPPGRVVGPSPDEPAATVTNSDDCDRSRKFMPMPPCPERPPRDAGQRDARQQSARQQQAPSGPRTEPGAAYYSVLDTIPMTDGGDLSTLGLILNETARKFEPERGERLDVVVLVSKSHARQVHELADKAERHAREVLTRILPGPPPPWRIRRATQADSTQGDSNVPWLSVRIAKVAPAKAVAE